MTGVLFMLGCFLAVLAVGIMLDTAIAYAVRRYRTRSMLKAIRDVSLGHAGRVAAPGKWKVWREPDGSVKHEVAGE